MAFISFCQMNGLPCWKTINIEGKTFFLAESEKPEEDRLRRNKAISEALGSTYNIRSALEESGINEISCKICEMIQECAYGMADITQNNRNVYIELGMMLALGKPTIILAKKGKEKQPDLPTNLMGREVVFFKEYLDIIDKLRETIKKLPAYENLNYAEI